MRLISLTLSLLLVFGCNHNLPAPVYERSPSFDRRVPDAYEVQVGDSLYAIAWRYQLNVNSIAEFNDLKPPYLLRPGKILRLKISRPEPPQKKMTVTNNVNKGITRAVVDKKTKNDAAFWSKPVKSEPTQKFGKTSSGVDYMLSDGEKIRASSSGVVVYAGTGLRGYISLVIIKHDSNWLSAYCMNLPYSVAEGDQVLLGESIAVNKSPENLTGKFHFEVRYKGRPIDPVPLFGRKIQPP